jgi:ABC-type multidrug transport system ATPase subunit
MEEAEVCCQKIGIMAQGQLRCIGTPTRLKHVYGHGYKLSLTSENMDKTEEFVMKTLPFGKELQRFRNSAKYSFIPNDDQLAAVFDAILESGQANGIKSWGISQTSLDEIFTNVISEEDAEGT